MTGAAAAGVLQVGSYATGYALNLLLARWLGASEFGRYTYVITIFGLLGVVATVGFSVSALKYIPQYLSSQDGRRLKSFLSQAQWSVVIASLVLGGVLFVSLRVLPFTFGGYAALLVYGLPLILLMGLMHLYSESLRAFGSVVKAYFPHQIMRPTAVLGLSAILVFTGRQPGAAQIVLAVVGVLLVVVLVQKWLLAGAARAVPSAEAADRGTGRDPWFQTSVSLLAIKVVGTLAVQLDLLLLGFFSSSANVGAYAIALRFAVLGGLSLLLINVLAAPRYVALFSSQRFEEMQLLAVRLAHVVFWPALAVCAILAYFGPEILAYFGTEFRAAYGALLILLLGQLFSVSTGTVGYIVDLTGHHRVGLYVRIATLLLSGILSVLLIPRFGVIGAAIAHTGEIVVLNISLYLIVARRLRLRMSIIDAVFGFGRYNRGAPGA